MSQVPDELLPAEPDPRTTALTRTEDHTDVSSVGEARLNVGANPTVEEVGEALVEWNIKRRLAAIKHLAETAMEGKCDVRQALDLLDIVTAEISIFEEEGNEVLVAAACEYPFVWWLRHSGTEILQATREDILEWWNYVVLAAKKRGYSRRTINPGRGTDLWLATLKLAQKMAKAPERYAFLPPTYVNTPELVSEKLLQVKHPEALIEILVGDVIDDMPKEFLESFVTMEPSENRQPSQQTAEERQTIAAERAVLSVMIILQREKKKA